MKIFPLKPMSTLDKFNNLIKIIEESKPKPKQNTLPDREVEIMGTKYSTKDLRSMYRHCMKQLNRDEFNKCNK